MVQGSNRGQVHCKDAIVRWNIFEDSCHNPQEGYACTGEIAAWDGNANSMDAWQSMVMSSTRQGKTLISIQTLL
ncbi:MAG: hypothetical protein IPJ67_00110 [Candidatus Moraniibacteriota bacterium]|nr:MAG: hypothetical protein IPJ67_00110 [Candidatus Moranbacteria bacterium]